MRGWIITCSFIFLVGMICCSWSLASQQSNPIIAFTSDTQQPLAIENVIRKLNHNQKATEMIFKNISAIRPAGLFILGDVVSLGYKNTKWKKIDTRLKLSADNNIPVYAVLGNHELILDPARGKRNF